ncbi:MAG: hemerythrin domain-containing protein [Flavobacteriales bacterium]|jgi:hemerythrin-like domain-containing protein|nr:hemerythrin domain-containing protein [Flavobacteriales bacterium]
MINIRIIDKDSKKRISSADKNLKRKIAQDDPIKREVTKEPGMDEGDSPMDPPEAYSKKQEIIAYEQMPDVIKKLMLEHKVAIKKLNKFEKALQQFKEEKWKINKEINDVFSEFFKFFDGELLLHNRKEEKVLFPLLEKRFRDSGEHGTSIFSQTPIDIFEDDHYQFIQLGTLAFNLIGISSRLPDEDSKNIVSDMAYQNSLELIEMLRLHIYREDETLFQLAHQLISSEEFEEMNILIEQVK